MAPTEPIPGFDSRLALYGIDDRTRSLLAETWPLIAPVLEHAIKEILGAVSELPRVGGAVAQNREMIKDLEVAHFQALLQGKLDQRYAESMGVHAHEEMIALFRRAATQADDADIRAFAARMLPGLQLDLQMARGLKVLTAGARAPGT